MRPLMTSADVKLRQFAEPGASASKPAGAYASFCRCGDLIYSSGVVAREHGKIIAQVLDEDSIEVGQKAVRLAVTAIFLGLQGELGSLEQVERVVSLNGFLRTDTRFASHVKIMDAASLLIQQLFPNTPSPARTTVGVATLPGGGIAEISMIIKVR
jgi:enamine deaminase RidA (YjgF/YER057c/UK114 family)